MTADTAINLAKTPIHISTQSNRFEVLDWFKFDGPSFQQYVTTLCSDADQGCLVMIESSPISWDTWERHPLGDELVIVLSGSGTFFHQIDGEAMPIDFKPGDTILNKRGVWHTADVTEALTAVYITTCPGTDHKPRD